MSLRIGARVASAIGLLVLMTVATSGQDRGLQRLSAPVGPGGQIRELYTGSHALLVGVAQYQDKAAWATLESIPRELQDLERTLKAQGFQTVETVLNPTGAQMRRAIEDFIGRHGFDPGHRLFFFFAGHGFTLDAGKRGFFVPRDAPDPLRDEPGFRRVALWMQQIATWAQQVTAKHVLFAFDSCFSGSIFRTRDRPIPQRISPTTAQPVRQFLSAGGANESVPAQSVFTPTLIKALEGAGDLDGDGFVTGTEVGNYVQREVMEYRRGQTPQFGTIREPDFDLGDIVFVPSHLSAGEPTAAPVPVDNLSSPARTVSGNPGKPPPVTTTDRTAIDETLNEYRRAYEALSVPRLQRVFPSLPDPEALATAFKGAREVLVGMSPPEVNITSATEATARTRLNQSFVPRVGVPQTAPTRDVTFRLRREGDRWIIVSLR